MDAICVGPRRRQPLRNILRNHQYIWSLIVVTWFEREVSAVSLDLLIICSWSVDIDWIKTIYRVKSSLPKTEFIKPILSLNSFILPTAAFFSHKSPYFAEITETTYIWTVENHLLLFVHSLPKQQFNTRNATLKLIQSVWMKNRSERSSFIFSFLPAKVERHYTTTFEPRTYWQERMFPKRPHNSD